MRTDRVSKAVIPAAGFGSRLFPASKGIRKEFFPIIDREARAKPAIMAIVEEAVGAGIEEVCLIVQGKDRDLFEEFFKTRPPIKNFNKLSKEDREYCQYLMELGERITVVTQDVQEGFGHAVFCAKDWVKGEPFLLLLGDHLYASDQDIPCARQLLDIYDRLGDDVVGLKVTPVDQVHRFGCAAGAWREPGWVLSIKEFYEKPDAEYARKHLHVDGMENDLFLTVSGQYVLTPKIFDYLERTHRTTPS